jgi:hypothetical protein
MAKKKGGGASAQSAEGKKLNSNEVSKVFSGVLISDLVTDDKGKGERVVLSKNKTLLGVVAKETADKLGGTVSKAFGQASKRYLPETLGLCRVELDDLVPTDVFPGADSAYTVKEALLLATGSQTALWRIIKGVTETNECIFGGTARVHTYQCPSFVGSLLP